MNAQELYEAMKQALQYFGLSFHQMHLISITLRGDELIMTHNHRRTCINLPPHK